MTEAQRKRIKRFINKWRPKLFLNEWFFDISYTKDNEIDASAEISIAPDYFRATIYIHPNFWKASLKDQEHTIVHELCHCLTEEAYLAHINMLNFKVVTAETVESIREKLTQRIANIAFQNEWGSKSKGVK